MSKGSCSVEGCESGKRIVKGMCINHYQNFRYANDIGAGRSSRVRYAESHREENREWSTAWYWRNREHRLAVGRAWWESHHDAMKAYQAAWYRTNADRLKPIRQRWAKTNADRLHALQKAWKRANNGRVREQSQRRRARMRENGYEVVNFAAILAREGMVCHICGGTIESRADLHFDHVIPLAKGGPHIASNIKPSHSLCNRRKGARIL